MRPARASDAEFLTAVYAATRRDEFAPLGWSDAQIEVFCRMQFDLQTQAYRMQFPGAENCVVELDEKAIGRLLVDRGDSEIRLVDVAFLPEFRGFGAGTAVVENLQREAASADKPLALRVLTTNRAAIRFYERLGFVAEESNQTHLSMCWRKETPTTSENSRT